MQANGVILDVGGVLRDAKSSFWNATQNAFKQTFGQATPFSSNAMRLRATSEFSEVNKFVSVVHALWKSESGEEVLEKLHEPHTIEEIECKFGLKPQQAEALAQLTQKIYYQTSRKYLHSIKPIAASKQALELMLSKGYRLGAFTNSISQFNTAWMKHWKLWEFFEVVLAKDLVAKAKPHPEGILAVATQMKISPHACWYAGDSAIDAHAAKKAGCKVCLLLSGWGSRKILEKEKPDLVCANILEFAGQLEPAT